MKLGYNDGKCHHDVAGFIILEVWVWAQLVRGRCCRALFGQKQKSVISECNAIMSEDCDLLGFGAVADRLEDQRPT